MKKCFSCEPGPPNDAPTVCLGVHLQASHTFETRTTRDLTHYPNKHALSFRKPTAYKTTTRSYSKSLCCSNHRPPSLALKVQLFLLRSPSSLQLQGCPIPLPRCIPPQAPLPDCDARALWYPTLHHYYLSTLLNFSAELHALPSPHTQVFVSLVNQVWLNCKRVEQITTQPRRHSLPNRRQQV